MGLRRPSSIASTAMPLAIAVLLLTTGLASGARPDDPDWTTTADATVPTTAPATTAPAPIPMAPPATDAPTTTAVDVTPEAPASDTPASGPDVTTAASSAAPRSGGDRPAPMSSVKRPAPRLPWFAPTASWNRPVSDFGPSATLQQYAERLWMHGGGAAPAGTVNVAFGDYSVPVYPVSEATTWARLYQTTWSMDMYGFGVPLGTRIPWNPAWHAGTGNDNLMAIVDESTGRAWELGGVGQQNGNCANRANVAAATRDNDATSVYLCLYGANIYDNLFTASDGSTVDGRGAGINKLALLTRADEVRSGAIRHALEMSITATMFGPACAPARGAGAPGAGVSCGFFLPPATKLERVRPDTGCPGTQEVSDAARSTTVPEGMRFALRIDDAQIEQWLDSRGYRGPLRSTAKVLAVALRDYGWIVAETGCWGMHIETDSVIGASGATWADLGIVSNGSGYPHGDLLAGLITPERIYVVEPPA